MKCLERNKRLFFFCRFLGETAITDSEGYETGEKTVSYSPPVAVKGNISQATGRSSTEQFGNELQYDKVIVLDDASCPIDESCVLFVDGVPAYDVNGFPLYDYIVKKVARSLNSVSIAVSRAEVS